MEVCRINWNQLELKESLKNMGLSEWPGTAQAAKVELLEGILQYYATQARRYSFHLFSKISVQQCCFVPKPLEPFGLLSPMSGGVECFRTPSRAR